MSKAKTSLSAVAVAGALVAAGVASVPSATAAPQRTRIAHTKPAWVAQAHSLGAAKSSAKSKFRVYLAPKGGTDALKAAVAAVSDPKSAGYRHFLTAKQYHAKYDASAASTRKVEKFLKRNDLTVTDVAAHRRYLAVSGTNAAVHKAFDVAIKRYRHRGQVVQANTKAVTVPSSIASLVTTVSGLDTTRILMKHDTPTPPPAGFRNGRPCSSYYGAVPATYQADFKTKLPKFKGKTLPFAVCGYTGAQYRSAYEGANPSGLTGKGVTVAVVDAFAAPTIAKDSNRYATNHGDGAYKRRQLTQNVNKPFTYQDECGENGWWGEETLDVEAVHAMAGDARIRYYGAASCQDTDLTDATANVVNENKASIITNSYGDQGEDVPVSDIAADQQVFLQAAMQGITFLFSSGDSGDETVNGLAKTPDYPATSPYITAVGGTADAIGSDGTFEFQTGWGTEKYTLSADQKSWDPLGYIYGAGGGNSALFNKPGYQKGVVPGSYGAGRSVPDVAMDADPTTGMLIGETQTFSDGVAYGEYRIGGTSLASPLFAGMTALLVQHAGGRVGFLNPTLYKQAGTSVLTDIKGAPADAGNVRVDYANGEDASDGLLYSVRTFNQDSSLATKKGWDDVTGVGSPNASWLTSVTK